MLLFVVLNISRCIFSGQLQCWIELGTARRWQIWMTLVSVMIFVLPALAIAACYTVIVLTIWTKSKAVVMSPPINSRRTKTLRNGELRIINSNWNLIIDELAKQKDLCLTLMRETEDFHCWGCSTVLLVLIKYTILLI